MAQRGGVFFSSALFTSSRQSQLLAADVEQNSRFLKEKMGLIIIGKKYESRTVAALSLRKFK